MREEKLIKSQVKIPDVDWSNVRSIYKKLSEEFHILTSAYQVEISERDKLMLDHLIIAIDGVDKCIDDIPDKTVRDEVMSSLLGFLKSDDLKWRHDEVELALSEKMELIKSYLISQNLLEVFRHAVEQIFYFTEEKRHTNSRHTLLDYIRKEGEATAGLPLCFIPVGKEHGFAHFFKRLCKLMGIADLIVDARSDYKNNYIVLKPGLRLYASLFWIFIRDGLTIWWNFPKKWSFTKYCVKFTWVLVFEKD